METSGSLIAEREGKMHEKETLDEKLPGLFEPDTLLPIQYFEAMRRKHLLEGEKRLILSVLEDAIECFMKCLEASSNKGQRLFRDAEEWINLEDKRWVFSFDNVCDMLDINPEYLRVGLRKWKVRRLELIASRAAEKAQEQLIAQAQPPVPAAPAAVAPLEAKAGLKPARTGHRKSEPVRRATSRRNKLRKARA